MKFAHCNHNCPFSCLKFHKPNNINRQQWLTYETLLIWTLLYNTFIFLERKRKYWYESFSCFWTWYAVVFSSHILAWRDIITNFTLYDRNILSTPIILRNSEIESCNLYNLYSEWNSIPFVCHLSNALQQQI